MTGMAHKGKYNCHFQLHNLTRKLKQTLRERESNFHLSSNQYDNECS